MKCWKIVMTIILLLACHFDTMGMERAEIKR